MTDQHPDPLNQSLSQGAERVTHLGSIVMAAVQVFARYRAQREREDATEDRHTARAVREQIRSDHQHARATWAPAHDARWLRQADVLQTAQTWGAAAPYAETDPGAAAAMRKSEQRLRTLHPHAMARYDRLRAEGMSPLDAMREATPLFARDPDVRTGDPAPHRRSLDAPPETGIIWTAADPPHGPNNDPVAQRRADWAEQRGWEIIERLQARARTADRPELAPDELATVLEAVTNLPEETIIKITGQARKDGQAVSAGATQPAGALRDPGTADAVNTCAAARTAAQVAAESFPYTITQAINAATTSGAGQGPRRVSTISRQPTPNSRRSL